MTDAERRELVKKYRLERVRAIKAFHRENFNGKALCEKFQLERMIIKEFEAMYGEPENDAGAD